MPGLFQNLDGRGLIMGSRIRLVGILVRGEIVPLLPDLFGQPYGAIGAQIAIGKNQLGPENL